MRSDVEYSPVGEGLGMRDFWLYAWMRRAAVIAAHVTGLGLTLILSLLSRPGTSEWTLPTKTQVYHLTLLSNLKEVCIKTALREQLWKRVLYILK